MFLFLYLICHQLEKMDWFETMLSKAGFSLVSRALSFILIKVGLSGCMVIAIEFAVKTILPAEGATTINHMQAAGQSSGSEAHSEPSADSSSAPSALDQRKDELIEANLLQRKGNIAEGQEVAEVRQAVETDFGIDTKGAEFALVKQMEKEVGSSKNEKCPATNSIFNEVKDFQSHVQDGRGRGKEKNLTIVKNKQHTMNRRHFSNKKDYSRGIRDPPSLVIKSIPP